jgi:hypothetical protein
VVSGAATTTGERDAPEHKEIDMSTTDPERKSIATLQEELKQRLREHTQQLVARGGPSFLVGRYSPLYQTSRDRIYGGPSLLPRGRETYYPLAAVLAALPYSSLDTLQEDWNEALGMEGPLPIYLHETDDGHYSAMMSESVVIKHLIALTD